MDRLANIEAFVVSAELGSFTRAARRLAISPSALSRRVGQLERRLGVSLFHRTTRVLRLSDEGRAFYERARAALRELEAASDETARIRDRPAGSLRVEAPTMLGRHVLVPALARFTAQYQEVQVELTLRDHGGDLVSEGIDVALRLGPLADSGLIARRLGTTRMRICAAPAYLRRCGRPRSVGALANHERLGLSVHGRVVPWRLRDGKKVVEIEPSRRIVVNSAEALLDLALSGAGLVWVCEFMMGRAGQPGQLVEVLPDAACDEVPIHVLALPARRLLPRVRVFLDFVAAELAAYERGKAGRRSS